MGNSVGVFALIDSILEGGVDLGVHVVGQAQAAGHQRGDLVAGGGAAGEHGRGVVSVGLIHAHLHAQHGDVVAAVSLLQVGLEIGSGGNGLDDGHIAGGHGEVGLEGGIAGEELDEEPAGQHFLLIILVEDAQAGALADDLAVVHIHLGNGGDAHFEGIAAVLGLLGTLIGGAGGGADAHIAAGLGGAGEQAAGVRAVQAGGGHIALVVPFVELLDEGLVGIVVKQIVGLGGAGVVAAILLGHGDEPVALAVIAQGDGVGVDLLDLGANFFQLVPGGGHGQAVGVEEGLVIVHDLGALVEGQDVHFAVAEVGALGVEAGHVIGLLLLGEADLGIVDQVVQGHHSVGLVIGGHVVGVAHGDVGGFLLVLAGDVGGGGVQHGAVVVALIQLHMDVGIQNVEVGDRLVEHGQLIVLLGDVTERDGHVAAVIAVGQGGRAGQNHHEHQDESEKFFHRGFLPFQYFVKGFAAD